VAPGVEDNLLDFGAVGFGFVGTVAYCKFVLRGDIVE
jgi:multisubunit Na+/H+ antiporter MnhF subunit